MSQRVSLAMTAEHHAALRRHLFPGDGKEAAAIALCGRGEAPGRSRLLVQELHPVPYAVCSERAPDRVAWPTSWLDVLLAAASSRGLSVVKLHSHTGDFRRFSRIDDASDVRLFVGIHAWFDTPLPHVSVVMMDDGSMFGRVVCDDGTFHPLHAVATVGEDLRLYHNQIGSEPLLPNVGRDTPAFGRAMVANLRRVSVAVIGCSGTGSIVVEQLARLGVGRLILIDPEVVETKNLNRIVNTTEADAAAGTAKVDVARRAVEAIGFGTVVETHATNLVSRAAVQAVAGCDVVVGCVDSAEARDVLGRISTYYLLPYIDVGVGIIATPDGVVDEINGAVHYVHPGGESLLARKVYRAEQVGADALRRRDPQLYRERLRQKYIVGRQEEAPAVISVNMLAASLAVNELLARLYGFRNQPNRRYDTVRFSLTEMTMENCAAPPAPTERWLGTGDTVPLLNLPELGG
jgi:hypothetical protein